MSSSWSGHQDLQLLLGPLSVAAAAGLSAGYAAASWSAATRGQDTMKLLISAAQRLQRVTASGAATACNNSLQ